MATSQVTINRRIDKLTVVWLYSRILFTHPKDIFHPPKGMHYWYTYLYINMDESLKHYVERVMLYNSIMWSPRTCRTNLLGEGDRTMVALWVWRMGIKWKGMRELSRRIVKFYILIEVWVTQVTLSQHSVKVYLRFVYFMCVNNIDL